MLTNMRTIKHSRKDCGGNLKSDTVKNDRWHQANGHGKKNEQTKGEVKKKKKNESDTEEVKKRCELPLWQHSPSPKMSKLSDKRRLRIRCYCRRLWLMIEAKPIASDWVVVAKQVPDKTELSVVPKLLLVQVAHVSPGLFNKKLKLYINTYLNMFVYLKSTWVMVEKEPVIPIQSTLILSALDCPVVSWKVVLKKPMHHWNLKFDGGRQQLTLLSCCFHWLLKVFRFPDALDLRPWYVAWYTCQGRVHHDRLSFLSTSR